MTSDLIHGRTRSAVRDYCSDYGDIRVVRIAFEDEGLDPHPDDDRNWDYQGQRRGVFDRYTALVDWTDPAQVRSVLNAFETILSWGGEYADESRDRIVRHLLRDGYSYSDGRIRSGVARELTAIPLEELRDASAIEEHLNRLSETMDRDPALAISSSKALIEATTKTVLSELGVPYDEKADVPALVKSAQRELKLDPASLAPTAAGVDIVKRILSNLSQVAIGIAELRNQYGPDHGRTTAVVGLGPRHAHLAVGAATTYCRMLLETLDARRLSEGRGPAPS